MLLGSGARVAAFTTASITPVPHRHDLACFWMEGNPAVFLAVPNADNQPSEGEPMSRRSERDRDFSDFVLSSRRRLLATAYLLCGDRHAAEDLVQTALAKLYVAWPRVRRAGAEHAYVRKILVNASIDVHRRSWQQERSVADVPEEAARPGYDPAERDELIRALDTLPPRQRRTIVLRYWLDLSIEEVADDLGVTTGTVKSQCAKGLAKLRQQLTGTPVAYFVEEQT